MFKVICIGDSLTTGYGICRELTWFNLLENKFDNTDFINKGINGNRSTDMLFRFYDDVLLENPTHCLILCGTNDFFFNNSSKKVFENIICMCSDCINNNVTPLLLIPILTYEPMAIEEWDSYIDYKSVNIKIEELKTLLKIYCIENNITIIDLNTNYTYYKNHKEEDLYIDGIHPSSLGHKLIYKNIFYNIYQLLN